MEWVFAHPSPTRIEEETRHNWAIILTWYFSTSNRLARDWATKALVSLLTDSLQDAEWLFRHFLLPYGGAKVVDDDYVIERLVCAIYGAAMRSSDLRGLALLAESVSERFFFGESFSDNFLIRDYARGIIELALFRGFAPEAPLKRIRPPYDSEGVQSALSISDLEKKYQLKEDLWDSGYRRAWAMIAPKDRGSDFAIYELRSVIGRYDRSGVGRRDRRNLWDKVPSWMLECMIRMGWTSEFD